PTSPLFPYTTLFRSIVRTNSHTLLERKKGAARRPLYFRVRLRAEPYLPFLAVHSSGTSQGTVPILPGMTISRHSYSSETPTSLRSEEHTSELQSREN